MPIEPVRHSPTQSTGTTGPNLGPRDLREYMAPLKPVVIQGALEHWPARQKWTLDFFRRQYGELPLEIKGRKLTMAELISEVETSTPDKPAPYLHNHLVSRLPEELRADIEPMPECTSPNWLKHPLISFRWPLTYVELYIGGTGAKFPVLHYDGLHTHAFLMQLHGVKEYIAFAPDQTPLMYAKSDEEVATFPMWTMWRRPISHAFHALPRRPGFDSSCIPARRCSCPRDGGIPHESCRHR